MITIDQLQNRIICADCLDILKQLPDKCIDLVLTDPPYGINADSKKFRNGTSKKTNLYVDKGWDTSIPVRTYFNEIFRISKNQIIFGGNYFPQYLQASSGWIFWDKCTGENSYSDGELAFTSFKRALKKYIVPWVGTNAKDTPERLHPTQKPVGLFMKILQDYSKENDLVLDCFSGSGTTAVACHNLHRQFICIEKNPEYYRVSCERLEQAQRQQTLF